MGKKLPARRRIRLMEGEGYYRDVHVQKSEDPSGGFFSNELLPTELRKRLQDAAVSALADEAPTEVREDLVAIIEGRAKGEPSIEIQAKEALAAWDKWKAKR